ncbi:MAG: hypothetical protein WAU50_13165, partial [Candidatus Sulfotelmatobacter sp.]
TCRRRRLMPAWHTGVIKISLWIYGCRSRKDRIHLQCAFMADIGERDMIWNIWAIYARPYLRGA